MTTSKETRKRRSGLAARLFAVAALGCTAFSTNTSYRYLHGHLGFTDPRELYGAFALLELLLLACAVGARQNLQDPEKQAPGAPGLLVWALAGFAAIPAFSVSGSLFAGIFRLVLGPVMAVVSFHLALGMELRHKRPDARSESMVRRIGRDLGQRIVSLLGLGTRDVSAQDLTRGRAVARAARTVVTMRRTADGTRRYARLGRRLDRALRIAEVDADAARVDALLARIAVAQHSEALTSIQLTSPWADRPAVAGAAQPEQQLAPAAIPEQRPEPESRIEPEPTLGADADLLLDSEPPAYTALAKAESVRRADAILPGRTPRQISEALAKVGVTANPNYVRTVRERAKADAANVIPMRREASGE